MAKTDQPDNGPKIKEIWEFKGKKRQLLEAMMEPENKALNVTDLTAKAGVSREYYYRCMADPEFYNTVYEEARKIFSRHLPRLANAVVEQGLGGDAKMARIPFEAVGMIGGRGGNQTVNVANYPAKSEPIQFETPQEALEYLRAEQADRAKLIAMYEGMVTGEPHAESEPVNVDRVGGCSANSRLGEPQNDG